MAGESVAPGRPDGTSATSWSWVPGTALAGISRTCIGRLAMAAAVGDAVAIQGRTLYGANDCSCSGVSRAPGTAARSAPVIERELGVAPGLAGAGAPAPEAADPIVPPLGPSARAPWSCRLTQGMTALP